MDKRQQQRERYATGVEWESKYGYSRAIKIGNQIRVCGTAPVDDDGNTVGEDAAAQTKFVIQKIQKALAHFGASLEDVVQTRIYVTDISQYDEIGSVHGEFFGEIKPVTTMVEVSGLIQPGMFVEIEAEAILQS